MNLYATFQSPTPRHRKPGAAGIGQITTARIGATGRPSAWRATDRERSRAHR